MRRFFFFLALTFWMPAHAAQVETLLKDSVGWDGGQAIVYPKGEAEITAVRITLKPGETMPFHCHPVPTFGYVLKGNLKVETLDGKNRVFKGGDAVLEVVDDWHRGINLSNTEEVEILAFYAGVKGSTLTIMHADEESRCGK